MLAGVETGFADADWYRAEGARIAYVLGLYLGCRGSRDSVVEIVEVLLGFWGASDSARHGRAAHFCPKCLRTSSAGTTRPRSSVTAS